MSTQPDKTVVENLLTDYADAINSANTAFIPSFYTEDGRLMPEGSKDLTKEDLVNRSQKFFKQVRFKIAYTVPDTIIIDGNYAFVQTTAKSTTTNLETNKVKDQTSRDFFVLRKEKEDWKIFRYVFNKFKVA